MRLRAGQVMYPPWHRQEKGHTLETVSLGQARYYSSEAERRGELEGWLHYYNQHRPHTACGNQPPFSRLINVSGQYS